MKKRILIYGLFFFWGCLLASQGNAQENTNYVALGDSAYEEFDNQTALQYYEKALSKDSTNFEALWRISRAYVDIGEHQPEDQQLAYYEKAKMFADSAIAVNSDHSKGYTRRAIALGRIALFKGVWKSVGIAKKVRDDCEKAISINPNDEIALYVYARSHHKVSEKPKLFRIPLGLGWGSKNKAKKYYEKALSLNPNTIMFNLDYARLLIDKDKYDKAREVLKKIPEMPITDEDDQEKKEEAARLLEEIKNK